MSAYIPNEIIEEINRRVDILDLVSRYVTLKRTGRNYVGLCPFHTEDTPSFTVTPDKQIYYCFGCQKGGGPINFIMEIENLTFPEAVEKLAGELGIVIPQKPLSAHDEQKKQEKKMLLNMHKVAASFYASKLWEYENARAAREYLKKRDIPVEWAKKFNLGFAPDDDWESLCRYLLAQGYSVSLLEKAGLGGKSAKTGKVYDKFHSRIIFPINDYKGQTIAFGGRIIGDGTPKYLNSTETPIYNKSANLYALHLAASEIRRLDCAVIMEGYMDVLMAHRYGVGNAVASLGTALTVEQAQLLHRYTDNVLLAYDGDSAGQKASLRGIEILRNTNFNIKLITLPEGMDPDEFLKKEGKEGWDNYIDNNALGVLEFLLQHAMSKYDKESVHGKSKIVAELFPAIAGTKSVVERDSFIRLMASSLEIFPETVYADLRKSGLKISSPVNKKQNTPIINIKLKSKTAPLLRLVLEDKAIFDKTEKELGLNFWETFPEQQLIDIVKENYNEYSWNPVSLLGKIENENKEEIRAISDNGREKTVKEEENATNSAKNEGIKQFLLKLLSKELPEENRQKLADEYIRAIKIGILQQEVENMLQAMQRGESTQELLREIMQKQKEMQTLRQAGN